MLPIYWDQFTWEAFATLATGIAAVGAALMVGLRQADIASRQTQILERQIRLDELKLRADLFNRRWQVYEATREFLIEIMRFSDEPRGGQARNFLIRMEEAPFLFRPEVHKFLREVWARSTKFFAVKKMMKHKYESEGEYGQENIASEQQYLQWLDDLLSTLGDRFGDELRLSTIARD